MAFLFCFLLLSDKNGIEGESITNLLIYRYGVQVYVLRPLQKPPKREVDKTSVSKTCD